MRRSASPAAFTGPAVRSARATGDVVGQARRGAASAYRSSVGIAAGSACHASDVPGAPVGVDQGDDAEVGQCRDDEPRQVRRRGAGVEGAGQLRAHLGQDGEAPRGPVGLLLRLAALGDLEEVDGQPVRRRPGAELEPAVPRGRVVGVEGHRDAGGDGRPVALLEDAAGRVGEGFPQDLPEQLVAGDAEEALGLGVDVREPPLPVQAVEAGRHRLEQTAHLPRVGPFGRRVVGRTEDADGGPSGPASARPRACTQRVSPSGRTIRYSAS